MKLGPSFELYKTVPNLGLGFSAWAESRNKLELALVNFLHISVAWPIQLVLWEQQ
jgi:hypothetical protein